ncbi:nucleoside-diphosphate sugar epimerase/dehydratase [uncultured Ilyobacter sp.]|uniref:polysaccharide biosynthesis protein n=1 Tax=uncultured Ilyobacter sp. TaxID=544433 RepID=UPI0029C67800|nr:nucleoside-diphosphate sugar epimerase/dehydratase [uncultured Ilyobacter sp.]
MVQARMRRSVKVSIDMLVILTGFVMAFLIKYDLNWSENFRRVYQIMYIFIYMSGYFLLRMQDKSWQYTSVLDIFYIATLNLGSALIFFLGTIFLNANFPKHLLVLIAVMCAVGQLTARYVFRLKRHLGSMHATGEIMDRKKVLVVGAGEAGENIARESLKNRNFKYIIVGFVDDDPKKTSTVVHGYEVLGKSKDLKELIKKYEIDELLIAIPSVKSKFIKEINKTGREMDIEVKVLPSYNDILEGKNLSTQVRDVKIEDLLGRNEVKTDKKNLQRLVEGKVIFVTGGAGSIGSELCRQIGKHNPKRLISIDINENALYFLELELKRKYPNLEIISEICSVRDREKIKWVFEKYKPQVVFHAAAHKHVPLMEHNPEEAIKNNIFGTKNVADCAHRYGVERFVLVSTDKAVNPTNIMGATKRACELLIQDMSEKSSTKYMAVRFGNVLGSNGSVIPLFKTLIEEKKNLTITHPDVTRFFMTIPEAARLVVEAGSIGNGGEVFILDMGESVKIMDLAKNLIELSGLTLGEDIDIDIVGLRPGEKLYEELLYDVSAAIKTENQKIFIAKLENEDVDVEKHLSNLKGLIALRDFEGIKEEMKKFISSYKEPEHHFECRGKMKTESIEGAVVV